MIQIGCSRRQFRERIRQLKKSVEQDDLAA
jgi:hypothetical protein